MELSSRKRAVLAAIIRTYIETGEPVGSKILTGLLENAPSSATLRNEMSELCGLGLLEQPHTSAGRVPTSLGFHLYVTSLMKPAAVSESTKRYINSLLPDAGCEPEQIPVLAGRVLSELTGFPAVSCYIVGRDVKVKRVELMAVGGRSAMLFLILSDGRSRSRLCRFPSGFSGELNHRFRDIVEKRIRNMPLLELNKAYLQNVIASSGFDSFVLMPLITALFEMAEESSVSPVRISGETNLYNICGEDTAQRILTLAQRRDPFLSLFERAENSTEIIFGIDSGFQELNTSTIVVSKYQAGNRYCGRIGIIGPNRMSYEQIIPSIEYTASRVSKLMTDAKKDMED